MLTDDTRIVPMILLAQAGASAVLAAALGLWQGSVVASSALAGGLTAVVPNAFFAARMLSPKRTPAAMLRAAWIGEVGKWLLTAVAFGAVFAFVRPLSAPGVFAGFIVAQAMVFSAVFLRRGATQGPGRLQESKKS